MKRLCFLLALAAVLPLISCGKEFEPIQTNETKQTQESKMNMTETKQETYDYPEVCDKLSLEKINSFPVASEEMSEEKLRRLCVEFFAYCQSFAWTPAEDYTYTIRSKNRDVTLYRGTVYGGLPYVTSGRGNIYRLMEYYDEETGVVDVKKAGADAVQFGNQCSFGSFWAWARVVNSAAFGGTNHLVAKNGFLPIGPYKYDFSISTFGSPNTSEICEANGEQIMFRSYAELKPADGIVQSMGRGHVIMCASEPVIVTNEDGTINGEESYFTYIHQASSWSDQKQSDGTPFRAQTVPYSKKTFAETYKENYVPFTFAEFTGEDPVERSETKFSHVKETMTVEELKQSTITSNYAVSHAVITVSDGNGNKLLTKTAFCTEINQKEFSLGSCLYPAELTSLANEGHTVTVSCRLANGETPTVYKGTLVS